MTIDKAIRNNIEVGTYYIGFQCEGEDDETMFFAEDLQDLNGLWEAFAKENDLEPDCVDYVSLNQSAPSILSEYLDNTGASIGMTVEGWRVEDYDNGPLNFNTWADMIRWMDEYNWNC